MMQKKSTMRNVLLRTLALIPAGMIAFASTPVNAMSAENPAKTIALASDQDADETKKANEDKIFTDAEVAPEFPGGMNEMYAFINKNLRYPEECAERNIQGRVTIQFVVEKDGSVGDIKIVRGKDPQLDGEAVRIIRKFPKFKPGTMNGEPVRVWYTFPINFKLQE